MHLNLLARSIDSNGLRRKNTVIWLDARSQAVRNYKFSAQIWLFESGTLSLAIHANHSQVLALQLNHPIIYA